MNIGKNQDGFVAIFVCIVIMLILGILVLSFSTISDKEVQTATNRELSLQALYASESGINDVYSIIRNKVLEQQTTSCTTDNAGVSYYYNAKNAKLSSNTLINEQYNCIFVNGTDLTSLVYNCAIPGVCPNDSLVSRLQSSNSTPIKTLTISWSDTTNNSQCTTLSSGFLPTYKSWPTCLPELLRVDIVALNPKVTTVDNIYTNDYDDARTLFIQPSLNSPSSSTAFGNLPKYNQTGSDTFINQTDCTSNANSTSTNCSFTVNGLPSSSSSSSTEYYVRIQYYYNPSQGNFSQSYPTISLCANGCTLSFENSQVQIDVNGYANSVEVRTDARVSLQSSVSGSIPTLPLPPNYAVQSYDSICKSLLVDANSVYEEIPSSIKGGFPSDLISPANTQTDPEQISEVNPSDFCDPIGVY